ncbi:NAD(P)-binding protein [Nemania sp. FL0031]|nr:NAD(P)-binding protein [Nemania sp. FL0031]
MDLVSKVPFQLTGYYTELNKWEVINGPGDARPTAIQDVKDENRIGSMRDKAVIVTATVQAMAATGATVFVTARNLSKAEEALGTMLKNGRVHLLLRDHTNLSSVRACAAEVRRRSPTLNIMINNAAVMDTPEERTEDGFELQFGTNHPTTFDNTHLDDGQSTTAYIYMANQIERLYGAQGLHGYSVSPGSFASPNLQKYCLDDMEKAQGYESMKFTNSDYSVTKYFGSPEQGASTSVYGAVSREIEGRGALYLEEASIAGPAPPWCRSC